MLKTMMTKKRQVMTAVVAASAAIQSLCLAAGASELRATSPCAQGETWSFSPSIDKRARKAFESLMSGKISPLRGFSEGVALEQTGPTAEARLFGRYLAARALLKGGLESASADRFAAIALEPPARDAAGVQFAALACLDSLHESRPAISVPAQAARNMGSLMGFARAAQEREALQDTAANIAFEQLADGASSAGIQSTLALLRGAGAFESFARAQWAASRRDYADTIAVLEPVLSKGSPEVPASLKRQLAHERLLLARAYYSSHRYDQAIAQYQMIDKGSNEFAEALSELSWSYLLANRYGEAVGTASSLRVGAMKNTFAPEAPLVSAMALNELCQYPDALRAVRAFQSDYESSYQWLTDWSTKGSELYPLAVDAIQGIGSSVPSKIAGEWVRSNVFLAGQDEIHRLIEEQRAAQDFIKGGVEELGALVRDTAEYNQFASALATARQIVLDEQGRSETVRPRWVRWIDAELGRRTERMLAELEDVRGNGRLVQVEIYNGASHDMIWRNAHPDYAWIERRFREKASQPRASLVWDWGRVDPDGDRVEVWEDELGSFKAKLYDNCSSKDKYLALKGLVSTKPQD